MVTQAVEAKTPTKLSLMPQRSNERLAAEIGKQILARYEVRSVLDVGCGDGVVRRHLPKGCKYKGVDISSACIYEQNRDESCIIYASPAEIPSIIEEESWNTILLLDVLEHTRDFTSLFELSLGKSERVVVSLPNELFIYDRLRMLMGRELNAHSLDLVNMPEGFRHQYIINLDKARSILERLAYTSGFRLVEEVQRPLVARKMAANIALWFLKLLGSHNVWSMGSIFIFERT